MTTQRLVEKILDFRLRLQPAVDPWVVKRERLESGKTEWGQEQLSGMWWRFRPSNGLEWAAVRMLGADDRRAFAAGHGGGLCLSDRGREQLEEMVTQPDGRMRAKIRFWNEGEEA